MSDREGDAFSSVLLEAGLEAAFVDVARSAFLKSHLSSREHEPRRGHVTSGHIARWRNEMPQSFRALYEKRFGFALRKLAYETSSDWIDESSSKD